jgi:hypothetical protein
VPRKRGRPPKLKTVDSMPSTNGAVSGDNADTEGNSVPIECVLSPLFCVC